MKNSTTIESALISQCLTTVHSP